MSIWFKRNLFLRNKAASVKKKSSSGKLIPLSRSISFPTRSVLVRMINDCLKLGATEVFIGSNPPYSFQFFAAGESYSGTLPAEAVENIRKLTLNRSPICLDWDEVDAEELRLGISTDGHSPIYCFSWKNKTSQANISEIQTQVLVEAVLDEKPLILIVDDDPRFSQILSRILEENGFQTLVATSGKEGLEILMDFSPELVITDVHMPHLSGPEFLLESRKRGHRLPYLVLTNDEDALTEAELILLGASAFVRKSEDPRVLLAWCRRLTSLKEVA